MNRIINVSIASIVTAFVLAGVFFMLVPTVDAFGGSGGGNGGGGGTPGNGCCSNNNNNNNTNYVSHSDNKTVRDNPPPPPPPPKKPICTISVSRTQITAGDSVTYTWTSQNGTSAMFTPIGNVALNASHTMALYETRTYTFQVHGPGGSAYCPATVTVIPKEEPKTPYCDMSGAPSTIKKGQSATISWTSANVSSASINQGIGSVSTNGSRTVSPDKTTTYTGSFTGYGKTVSCNTTIVVKEDEPKDDLWCKLKVSDDDIRKGDRVKLSWDSEGADYGKINEGIGRVDEEGYEYVYPKEDTTYKATFYSKYDDDDTVTCKVEVEVEKDKFVPPPQTPYITLSAVPYTGLDLGPVGTAVYWAFLMLWCVLAAYLVAVKRIHVGIYRVLFGTPVAPVQTSHVVQVAPKAPANAGMDPFLASQIYKKS